MQWQLTHLKPSEGIRCAVGDRAGQRSSTFRFWGNKKGDFYVAARALGGTLKASLHRDGRCQIGFTNEFAAKNRMLSRHIDRWEVPLGEQTKAIQVIVAEADLTAYEKVEREPTRWLRAPNKHHLAIIGVVILPTIQIHSLDNFWPGATVGTEPIGVMTTAARTAFVLHWENALTPAQDAELKGLRLRLATDAKKMGIAPAPGLRALFTGTIGDGLNSTRTLIDVAYDAERH